MQEAMRVCTRCNSLLARAEFHRNNARSDGLQVHCRTCCREKQLKYRWKYAGLARERFYAPTGWIDLTKERPVGAACEMCGRSFSETRSNLDHDHVTGRFRGWLCTACNTSLGKLGDDQAGLDRASIYLARATLDLRSFCEVA